jgi:hypothetical protein
MSNFSLLDTLNGSRWDTSANNINTVGYVSCNGGTEVGTYYSNNVSAFRVPNGPTSSRPSPGLTGYLRFNTDSCYNCLEYYDPLSALWTPIYPIPTITSITPDYVTDTSGGAGYYNTNPLIISGYGYVPGCTVSYRGTDSSVYAAPVTTYISNIQLRATVPASVYNGYNQDPFTIIVTNPTGVSGFLLNALDVDPSASWVTPAGLLTNSAGATSVDSSAVLTTTAPYFRVQAIDLEGLPLTYNSPDLSSNSATSKCAITTVISGSNYYGYITGTPYTLASATVSFTINALDGRTVVPRNFSLNVNAALRTANVSSAFAYQITYTNSSGLLPVTTGPYPNGYTVYTFNPNASSQVLAPSAQSSQDTYQTAVATYTFTPLFTSSTIAALIVGGGGMGAGDGYNTTTGNGGGGGGGYYSNIGGAGLTVTNGTTYTVTVGAGGYAGASVATAMRRGGAGSSIIGGAISQSVGGGGGGGYWSGEVGQNGGTNGGSGGGGAGNASGGTATGGKGNNGAQGPNQGVGPGGGGGGAGQAGSGANGGNGQSNSISGISVTYAGGGGGSGGGSAGSGGGSAGAPVGNTGLTAAQMTPAAGTDGLGGGSGAQVGSGRAQADGGLAGVVSRGGTGVVIIRFLSYSG